MIQVISIKNHVKNKLRLNDPILLESRDSTNILWFLFKKPVYYLLWKKGMTTSIDGLLNYKIILSHIVSLKYQYKVIRCIIYLHRVN